MNTNEHDDKTELADTEQAKTQKPQRKKTNRPRSQKPKAQLLENAEEETVSEELEAKTLTSQKKRPRGRPKKARPAQEQAIEAEDFQQDIQEQSVAEQSVQEQEFGEKELPSVEGQETAEKETKKTPKKAPKPKKASPQKAPQKAQQKALAAKENQKAISASPAQIAIEQTEAPLALPEAESEAPKEKAKGKKKQNTKEKAKKGAKKQETEEKVELVAAQMLVSVVPNEQAEVVIVEEGQVKEYYVEMAHQEKIRGNIYKGIVNNIDTNLQAAFVNFGGGRNGFLQIDEVHPEYWLQHYEPVKGHKYPPIQKVMKVGQEVMVQVVKEPSGSKGAFLTTWISLAGRFLVLTPGQEQIGISRKVEDEEERTRLRELIRGLDPGPGLGAIVRTVSVGTSKTTLQKDLNFLKRLWKDVLKKVTKEEAPALIYQEPHLAARAIRDYLSENVDAVWVDDADTMDSISHMVQILFPRKKKLVHLYTPNTLSLWNHFKVQKQLDQVYSREVALPSGGRLVFDQTEALMAIDINSGRTSGKNNFETMALRTNLEAAKVIAQQLRLRDIGGQVVIDFIEMRDQNQCREVEKTLRTAMKCDRARHDVLKISEFGLLELVRQRIGSSAISLSQEPCPICNGTGVRRKMEWQALRTVKDMALQAKQAHAKGIKEILYAVEREVGLYLLNHKRQKLLDIETEWGVRVHVSL